MTLETYKELYKGMSAADVRSLISLSKEFRTETERLYTGIYHQKINKSCGDCWLDAYILIMRGNPEQQKAMAQKIYNLRAGAVLVDPYGDPKKTVTHHNITDDLALYHLRTHPECAKFFSTLPPEWQAEARKSAQEKPITIQAPEDNSDLEAMSDDELAVFDGYNRQQRDRIREIMTGSDNPEEALDKCSVLESEGFKDVADKIRNIIMAELDEKAAAEQEAKERAEAEAAEKAVAEAKKTKK